MPHKRVTANVRDGIVECYLDDGMRVERFDALFVHRYLEAYPLQMTGKAATQIWALGVLPIVDVPSIPIGDPARRPWLLHRNAPLFLLIKQIISD